MPRLRLVVVACWIFAAVGSAAAQSPMQRQGDEIDNPADKAFLAAMHDLMVGMHRGMPTGDTDIDFARLMLPHQQSALAMAKAELQYGKDEGLKAIAQEIVTSQEKEIAMLKAWEDKRQAAH